MEILLDIENRYYLCIFCDSYHTTKMNIELFGKIKRINPKLQELDGVSDFNFNPVYKTQWEKLINNEPIDIDECVYHYGSESESESVSESINKNNKFKIKKKDIRFGSNIEE